MAVQARRIAPLGREEVTHAAEILTETVQEDVGVCTRFIKASQATTVAADGRPVHVEAVADATEEFRQRTEQLVKHRNPYRDQGPGPRDLDGSEVMQSMEQYRQASKRLVEHYGRNFEHMSATMNEARAMVNNLRRNKEAQELSRERFTSAARKALGTPPLSA